MRVLHRIWSRLLRFMERRWRFQFKDDEERESLLFLNPLGDA